MTTFNDVHLTLSEFSRFAGVKKEYISFLEKKGMIKTSRIKSGNVEKKIIPLSQIQNYCRNIRQLDIDNINLDSLGRIENTTSEKPLNLASDDKDKDKEIEDLPQTGATPAGKPISVEFIKNVPNKEDWIAMATRFQAFPPKYKIQMFYNVKGGTGKSTITAQYVMQTAMIGLNVLALDLDGQGHLSLNLDVLDSHERPTIYDVLINDLPIEEAIVNIAPGLDLLPANLGLCNIEIPLNQRPRREYRLKEAIAKVSDKYDLVVADTNPAASLLNSSMLVTAELVNVVCATNPLSFHGMSLVMSTIKEMEKEFGMDLVVKIIPNMYDTREIISQEVLGELRENFPKNCTKSIINRSVDLNEATKQRTTVWEINSKGTAAKDISSLSNELISV